MAVTAVRSGSVNQSFQVRIRVLLMVGIHSTYQIGARYAMAFDSDPELPEACPHPCTGRAEARPG